ncbi:MAG: dipeptide epimerase [Hyphomicrobiaceae bacterium]|nr:dipeptide epimerase [Hyphomicrobiaceae bacterium]
MPIEPLHLTARAETFALADAFVISRGAKTEAHVIVAEVRDDAGHVGRGEAVPYARYGETVAGSLAVLDAYSGPLDRDALLTAMPAGAARNALDCALWDVAAKSGAVSAPALAGCASPVPVETAYTLSLGSPEAMAAKARSVAHLGVLKLKLGGAGDAARMLAVRAARPDARLIADANEAWTPELLPELMAAAVHARVALIEQPLPAGADGALAGIARSVPVCADESAHTAADLPGLRDRYDAINIKLDKSGGLTAALAMRDAARALGFQVMIGSMVATSLAAAPALILAQGAEWVDLDGPLLLAGDRPHGLVIRDGWIAPPERELWG